MLRTQISLTADERALLDAEAARTGRSVSALIRAAVDAAYGAGKPASDDLTTMREAFGSWGDNDESGAAYVDRLRSGSRIPPR